MSKEAVPKIKDAKKILETASKLPFLSSAVKLTLKSYVEDLDGLLRDLGDEWTTISPEARVPLPNESKKSERMVLKLVYGEFRNVEFSRKDVEKFLWDLAAKGTIPRTGASSYGHTLRLYKQGLVSRRYIEDRQEYKFSKEGHKFLGSLTLE
jgi:hypothetical protein